MRLEGGGGGGQGGVGGWGLRGKANVSLWSEPKPQILTPRFKCEGAALCATNPNSRSGLWTKNKAPLHRVSLLPCKYIHSQCDGR